eukprot:SAG31_NODE_14448_length_806_cov_0.874116_1_plen_151_part_10
MLNLPVCANDSLIVGPYDPRSGLVSKNISSIDACKDACIANRDGCSAIVVTTPGPPAPPPPAPGLPQSHDVAHGDRQVAKVFVFFKMGIVELRADARWTTFMKAAAKTHVHAATTLGVLRGEKFNFHCVQHVNLSCWSLSGRRCRLSSLRD